MQPEEYERMSRLEDEHWWYQGLRDLVLSYVERIAGRRDARVLDAGCGTGGLLARLRRPGSWGVEIADAGIRHCRRRGLGNVIQASVLALPFRSATFDAAISLDVLQHEWIPDDVAALRELCRVLVPGGMALVHLPAYGFLRGGHDRAVLTRHRYTRGELAAKFRLAGFRVVRLTYRNTVWFAAAVLMRWIVRGRRRAPTGKSDLFRAPRPVNRALAAGLALENRVVRHVRLPFGVSVFGVAEKP